MNKHLGSGLPLAQGPKVFLGRNLGYPPWSFPGVSEKGLRVSLFSTRGPWGPGLSSVTALFPSGTPAVGVPGKSGERVFPGGFSPPDIPRERGFFENIPWGGPFFGEGALFDTIRGTRGGVFQPPFVGGKPACVSFSNKEVWDHPTENFLCPFLPEKRGVSPTNMGVIRGVLN